MLLFPLSCLLLNVINSSIKYSSSKSSPAFFLPGLLSVVIKNVFWLGLFLLRFQL